VVINPNIFRARPGVPGREWPISAADLRPYYKRAAELIGARRPVSNRWEPEVQAEMVPIERYPSGKEEKRFDRDIKHTARYTRTASVRFENVWD
jgi:hypothetical protein